MHVWSGEVIWADSGRGTREDLYFILPHSNAQALQDQGCLTHVETLTILSTDCPVTQIHIDLKKKKRC